MIKAKAKDCSTGDWVYGTLVYVNYGDGEDTINTCYIITGYEHNPTTGLTIHRHNLVEVLFDTVCQLLGMENGKEIYESDIVKDDAGKYLIEKKGLSITTRMWMGNRNKWGKYHSVIKNFNEFIPIGNIHDNL